MVIVSFGRIIAAAFSSFIASGSNPDIGFPDERSGLGYPDFPAAASALPEFLILFREDIPAQ